MTQRKNKDGGPQPTRQSVQTTNNTATSDGKTDKHEYDPGGMAGQKAGIVEEIEHDDAVSDAKRATADKAPRKDQNSATKGSKKA